MINSGNSIKNEARLQIIDITRFAACLMIFFYHCNTILPGSFKWLTFFGEDMGNELFFMISGFALYPSVRDTEIRGFPAWYSKRLMKILPVLILTYFLSFLTGFYSFKDPLQLFAVFVYPTLYWFVTGILVFYILLFFYLKIPSGMIRSLILAALIAAYIFRADRMEGYYLIGAFAMAAGAELRGKTEDPGTVLKDPGKCALGFTVSFCLYMVTKYLKFTGNVASLGSVKPVFIFSGIAAVLTGGFILAWGYIMRERIDMARNGREGLLRFVRYVGNLALPVYLVQCFNAGIIGYTIGQRVRFPLSFILNFLVVWGLAVIVGFIPSLFRVYGGKHERDLK